MRVIGTAGHVDHGKSTLVEALTGTHPDRLREEIEREMTIVLGFSWATLPNGEEIGIVDVPGHRDFIENMLSGIGGIDAVLFVIAADEGVMPQTKEHLSIIDLLDIQSGVVVLTKIDLVEDEDWLDLVESDIQETLSGTILDSAPIVRVSAKTGERIPELLDILGTILAKKPSRPDFSRPRLAIDRVFSISGFGTIVTGTLIDGQFQVGQDISILPQEINGRIRGLQTHKKKEKIAVPGSRTAVNISGVNVDQVQRGDVVVYPNQYKTSRRLDVHFRLLSDVSQSLRHNTEVKLFIGAAEVVARLRLLGTDILKPGDQGWLQLELNAPVVCVRGDRYILRRPSPGETLGGGVILDPHPNRRHKRFDENNLKRFEALINGEPEDILLQSSLAIGATTKKFLFEQANLDQEKANLALKNLLELNKIILLEEKPDSANADSLLISTKEWEELTENALEEISAYHKRYPLRVGIPREEFKSRLKVSQNIYNASITRWVVTGRLDEASTGIKITKTSSFPVIKLAGHKVDFSSQQQILMDNFLARFNANPFSPPTVKEAIKSVGDEIFNAMVDLGILILLSTQVIIRTEDYYTVIDIIKNLFKFQDTISVAQVRDELQTSRRFVLALLEHFDSIGITIRVGDVRKLK